MVQISRALPASWRPGRNEGLLMLLLRGESRKRRPMAGVGSAYQLNIFQRVRPW